MKTRILLLAVITSCLFTLGIGCQKPHQSLLGEWECINLSKMEHVSQFAKEVINFQPNGVITSYLIDHNGQKIQEPQESYRLNGDVLLIGDGDTCYRFVVKNDVLSLSIIKSIAGTDVGKTVEFHRKDMAATNSAANANH